MGGGGEAPKTQKKPNKNSKLKNSTKQTAQHLALKTHFHFLFHQYLKVLHQSFSWGLELNTIAGGPSVF